MKEVKDDKREVKRLGERHGVEGSHREGRSLCHERITQGQVPSGCDCHTHEGIAKEKPSPVGEGIDVVVKSGFPASQDKKPEKGIIMTEKAKRLDREFQALNRQLANGIEFLESRRGLVTAEEDAAISAFLGEYMGASGLPYFQLMYLAGNWSEERFDLIKPLLKIAFGALQLRGDNPVWNGRVIDRATVSPKVRSFLAWLAVED